MRGCTRVQEGSGEGLKGKYRQGDRRSALPEAFPEMLAIPTTGFFRSFIGADHFLQGLSDLMKFFDFSNLVIPFPSKATSTHLLGTFRVSRLWGTIYSDVCVCNHPGGGHTLSDVTYRLPARHTTWEAWAWS